MDKYIKSQITYNPWMYSIIGTLLVFIFGLSIITYQSINSYNENVEQKLQLATKIIDNQINDKNVVFSKLDKIKDHPCEQLRQEMVDMIMNHNQFQTLNIVKNHNVVCSTNPRLVNDSPIYDLPNDTLHVVESQVLTPGTAIFFIHRLHNGSGAFITINSRVLSSSLEYISDGDLQFRIKTAEGQVDKHGKTQDTNLKGKIKILHSKQFDYSVKTRIQTKNYVHHLIGYYSNIIILIFIVSLVIGKYIHESAKKKSTLFFMKSSIKKNEFVPFAQPVMDKNGNVTGCEILMRWKNKQAGYIFPDKFIPVAEKSGLIIPMTDKLLERTYELFKTCEDKLPEDFHIGVNISPQHFDEKNHNGLIEACKAFYLDSLSKRARLVLELTERTPLENYADANHIFDQLHEMNISMAIDDFGTGHSTLTYIQNLNFDLIKIDKSFIDYIGTDAVSAPLVDNIIDLAQRLHVKIVAEGVETKDQLDYLVEKNVDYIQGYYYSKPIPLEEFIDIYINIRAE
ncbi:MAG: EAL domain-containing protein [Vibrio sp.]